MKSIFVTVGSTSFPKLTDLFINPSQNVSLLTILKELGFRKISIQKGNAKCSTSPSSTVPGVDLTCFGYKQDLTEEYSKADLVISHAGSGSIVESLRLKKKTIVVVNAELMNNHQLELAQKLESLNYLITCTPTSLQETIHKALNTEFEEFPSQNTRLLQECLTQIH